MQFWCDIYWTYNIFLMLSRKPLLNQSTFSQRLNVFHKICRLLFTSTSFFNKGGSIMDDVFAGFTSLVHFIKKEFYLHCRSFCLHSCLTSNWKTAFSSMNEPQVSRRLSACDAWCAPTQGMARITLPLMCSATTQWHWHIGVCCSFTNGKPFTVE